MQQRGGPAGQPALGMPDQRRRRVAERTNESGRVPGERPAVVAAGRLVAAAAAAQVDRDHSGTRECTQLMTPGPPERSETMQQDHQWPRRGWRDRICASGLANWQSLDDMESDAIGVHVQMPPWPVDA